MLDIKKEEVKKESKLKKIFRYIFEDFFEDFDIKLGYAFLNFFTMEVKWLKPLEILGGKFYKSPLNLYLADS